MVRKSLVFTTFQKFLQKLPIFVCYLVSFPILFFEIPLDENLIKLTSPCNNGKHVATKAHPTAVPLDKLSQHWILSYLTRVIPHIESQVVAHRIF